MNKLAVTVTPNVMLAKMITLPHFRKGAQIRPSRVLTVPGGKGIHVARVIQLLGGRASALGCVAGSTGKAVVAGLAAEGFDFEPVWGEGETRLGICLLEEGRGPIIEVPEPGPPFDRQAEERLMDRLVDVLRKRDRSVILVLSGSLPKGFSSDFFRRVVQTARQIGIETIVDSHGEALRQAIDAQPFVVKPNLEELALLAKEVGRPEVIVEEENGSEPVPLADLAWRCREVFRVGSGGVRHVILSMGPRGVLWVNQDQAYHMVGPEVAGNPIGSGDSLVAGLVRALESGYDFEAALREGVACSVANLGYDWPGYCTWADVKRLTPAIAVERLSTA